jgi:hypothetical protein
VYQSRYVLIDKFEDLAGYTRRSIEGKIATGVWREGHEYRKAPDGHILVDMEGFYKWVEGQKRAG